MATQSPGAGSRVAKNAVWSVAGLVVPAFVALITIPFLISKLGLERFGLLALIWMGVGYFSLFDMGIGRALNQQISTRLAHGHTDRLSTLVRTGVWTLAALGTLASVLVGLLAPWLVNSILRIDPSLQRDAVLAIWVLAASLPAVLLSTGQVAVLEGFQQFRSVALVRIPLGISNFVMPALVSVVSQSLADITLSLILARLITIVTLRKLIQQQLSTFEQATQFDWSLLSGLLRFGGWITVSSLVSPVLVYFDRFFISAIRGLEAVAHYVTPFELLSRLTMLPQAIMAALFPALTQAIASASPNVASLSEGAGRVMLLALLPITLCFAMFPGELLTLWLGEEFSEHSSSVVRLLSAGIMVNTLARVPFTALHSAGRADVTAMIHLVEVVPYLLTLWWAVSHYGAAGAALAWLLRVSVDCLILWKAAARHIPALAAQAARFSLLAFVLGPMVALSSQTGDLFVRLALWLAILLVCSYLLYRMLASTLKTRFRNKEE